jgi:hypothetical protein
MTDFAALAGVRDQFDNIGAGCGVGMRGILEG